MRIAIRVDGNTQMGTGHAMRCIALAQAAKAKGACVQFLMAECTPSLRARIEQEGISICFISAIPADPEDAALTKDEARRLRADWLVLDGYHFDKAYCSHLLPSDFKLMQMDDYGHARSCACDLLLNQNIGAHADQYEEGLHTRILLGPRYALLRREFLEWLSYTKPLASEARNILVTLGGSDPANVALKVLSALSQCNAHFKTKFVIGGSNPHFSRFERQVRSPRCDIELLQDVSNMPELMAWADLAVTAGGSTCWETAMLGLPSLIIQLANNQKLIAQGLQVAGVAQDLGWHEQVRHETIRDSLTKLAFDAPLRSRMSAAGKKLVDGKGADRVVAVMASYKDRS